MGDTSEPRPDHSQLCLGDLCDSRLSSGFGSFWYFRLPLGSYLGPWSVYGWWEYQWEGSKDRFSKRKHTYVFCGRPQTGHLQSGHYLGPLNKRERTETGSGISVKNPFSPYPTCPLAPCISTFKRKRPRAML
jgi:hypothetical protein